jgi:DNA-directed RNA polymerase sigma subunit (sigma70/sigma32)
MRSTLPLFPTDDGWPYPDTVRGELVAEVPDLDALELLGPHVYDGLTSEERAAILFRFGLFGTTALSMKELAPVLGCTRAEAGVVLGRAIDKMRSQLLRE